MILLTPALVLAAHDAILNPGELQGLAGDKSLESALARVDNRLAYGLIADVFDLAAATAEAIAQRHCFNDGNKRTAHQCMDLCLAMNGVEISWDMQETGDSIIALSQRKLDAGDMADWLRARA